MLCAKCSLEFNTEEDTENHWQGNGKNFCSLICYLNWLSDTKAELQATVSRLRGYVHNGSSLPFDSDIRRFCRLIEKEMSITPPQS